MTVRLVDLVPEHLQQIRPQRAQRAEFELAEGALGHAWTAIAGDTLIACGGLVELWQGRAYAWAVLAQESGPHFVALTRAIRFQLDAAPFGRIEMVVDATFRPGYRWAELLGFTLDAPEPLRSYLPGGRDAWLFSRVK